MRTPQSISSLLQAHAMLTILLPFTVAMCLVMGTLVPLSAATPGQAYHRTPGCVDGNCVPNRATNGYYGTRWRPWPGGEPSQSTALPPVGIELQNIQTPPRDKELEMPVRPTAPDGAGETNPKEQPGGSVIPPELRGVTPAKPVEQPLPGNSSIPRGPMFPAMSNGQSPQPLLLSKKPEPLRSASPMPLPREIPATEQPTQIRIRPAGNSQSGLMPEMVPWSDEDKNPVIRQATRLNGNQVHQTISLDETALPNANEKTTETIRVIHESSANPPNQPAAIRMTLLESKTVDRTMPAAVTSESTTRLSTANAPAILPAVEAQPLMPAMHSEQNSGQAAAASPLRGLSSGNPLRR